LRVLLNSLVEMRYSGILNGEFMKKSFTLIRTNRLPGFIQIIQDRSIRSAISEEEQNNNPGTEEDVKKNKNMNVTPDTPIWE
jgi:hypothetical protein